MAESYEEKRSFAVTPEPSGAGEAPGTGPLRFCIQKHAARRLHYDLRLELDGALVSWAVPKGPSLDPQDKHLAVKVEDHPLSYTGFEGQIPKGEYGAGEMIVWDEGVYSPDEGGKLSFDDRDEAQARMRDELAKGKLSITLRGKKLAGSWTLVKTARGPNEWLLIKHQDEHASSTRKVLDEGRSVVSGRTIEDVRAGRAAPAQGLDLGGIPGAQKASVPRLISPMLCTEMPKLRDDPGWIFEVKLDGIRVIAIVEDRKARLLSRNGHDITPRFPALAAELSALPHRSLVLDGEVVLYDSRGVPSFQALMERFQLTNPADVMRAERSAPVEYCVFDLLFLDGWDLRQAPLVERRRLMEEAVLRGASLRTLDAFSEHGQMVYDKVRALGFEGVVGKKLDSRYREGVRGPNWIKVKGYHSDDFLVVGYTRGEGSRRSTFGALVLAERDGDRWAYRGNVGGGFSDAQLDEIRALLDATGPGDSPFEPPVKFASPVVWVAPRHWAEVRYMERTREGLLRMPVFLRLRPDLTAPATTGGGDPPADDLSNVREQLGEPKQEFAILVEGETVRFTHMDRELWPAWADQPAITKRLLATYYAKVSSHFIAHLRDRPLSLVRCPDGIAGEHFFQKHWEKGVPDFVERVMLWSSHSGRSVPYLLCNNLATLLWMAQMSVLEIHPWYSRVAADGAASGRHTDFGSSEESIDGSALDYPDFLVVDLDPNVKDDPASQAASFAMTVDVALGLKEMLDGLGIPGFLKTSGKSGLHIYLPIERNVAYDAVRKLAETLGRHLERAMPDKVTMEWTVSKRPEKVFFDHNQNVRGKTLAAAFSPRPVPGAPVSFPIEWSALRLVSPSHFTVLSAPAAVGQAGDPWQTILSSRADLRAMLH
ncbi:MAG: ATP-dependent DNA ligase [Fimbriimonas ginsengisoli]|uniref:DNA ligase (ATP) n=1 Tax=Fimbriimonas ginsengisoli TaxID=1005039 RepID=A0A931LVG0_FIMGI|nr:ATP-dependent DNA ligase [Fimbriimonas ginsengisoli]